MDQDYTYWSSFSVRVVLEWSVEFGFGTASKGDHSTSVLECHIGVFLCGCGV